MKLDQVTASYQREQDRILVRMNTSSDDELRLWLTRRMCLRLWPNLNTVVADRVALMEGTRDPARSAAASADEKTRQMMADFHREATLQTADFRTPFRSQPLQFPLGEQPLVVTEVGLTNLPDGKLRIDFKEKLPDAAKPRSFQVNLENRNLQGLLHLLEKALEHSGWLADGASATLKTPVAAPDERPKYLN
jgi:hypothetical protein